MTIPLETNLCGINATWAAEIDVPFWPGNTATSAPGEGVKLTYPPIPGVKYRVGGLTYSCFGVQKELGNPTIEIYLGTGELVFRINVAYVPVNTIIFKPPASTPPGVGLTITMSAAGAGVVCLNPNVWAYTSKGTQ